MPTATRKPIIVRGIDATRWYDRGDGKLRYLITTADAQLHRDDGAREEPHADRDASRQFEEANLPNFIGQVSAQFTVGAVVRALAFAAEQARSDGESNDVDAMYHMPATVNVQISGTFQVIVPNSAPREDECSVRADWWLLRVLGMFLREPSGLALRSLPVIADRYTESREARDQRLARVVGEAVPQPAASAAAPSGPPVVVLCDEWYGHLAEAADLEGDPLEVPAALSDADRAASNILRPSQWLDILRKAREQASAAAGHAGDSAAAEAGQQPDPAIVEGVTRALVFPTTLAFMPFFSVGRSRNLPPEAQPLLRVDDELPSTRPAIVQRVKSASETPAPPRVRVSRDQCTAAASGSAVFETQAYLAESVMGVSAAEVASALFSNSDAAQAAQWLNLCSPVFGRRDDAEPLVSPRNVVLATPAAVRLLQHFEHLMLELGTSDQLHDLFDVSFEVQTDSATTRTPFLASQVVITYTIVEVATGFATLGSFVIAPLHDSVSPPSAFALHRCLFLARLCGAKPKGLQMDRVGINPDHTGATVTADSAPLRPAGIGVGFDPIQAVLLCAHLCTGKGHISPATSAAGQLRSDDFEHALGLAQDQHVHVAGHSNRHFDPISGVLDLLDADRGEQTSQAETPGFLVTQSPGFKGIRLYPADMLAASRSSWLQKLSDRPLEVVPIGSRGIFAYTVRAVDIGLLLPAGLRALSRLSENLGWLDFVGTAPLGATGIILHPVPIAGLPSLQSRPTVSAVTPSDAWELSPLHPYIEVSWHVTRASKSSRERMADFASDTSATKWTAIQTPGRWVVRVGLNGTMRQRPVGLGTQRAAVPPPLLSSITVDISSTAPDDRLSTYVRGTCAFPEVVAPLDFERSFAGPGNDDGANTRQDGGSVTLLPRKLARGYPRCVLAQLDFVIPLTWLQASAIAFSVSATAYPLATPLEVLRGHLSPTGLLFEAQLSRGQTEQWRKGILANDAEHVAATYRVDPVHSAVENEKHNTADVDGTDSRDVAFDEWADPTSEQQDARPSTAPADPRNSTPSSLSPWVIATALFQNTVGKQCERPPQPPAVPTDEVPRRPEEPPLPCPWTTEVRVVLRSVVPAGAGDADGTADRDDPMVRRGVVVSANVELPVLPISFNSAKIQSSIEEERDRNPQQVTTVAASVSGTLVVQRGMFVLVDDKLTVRIPVRDGISGDALSMSALRLVVDDSQFTFTLFEPLFSLEKFPLAPHFPAPAAKNDSTPQPLVRPIRFSSCVAPVHPLDDTVPSLWSLGFGYSSRNARLPMADLPGLALLFDLTVWQVMDFKTERYPVIAALTRIVHTFEQPRRTGAAAAAVMVNEVPLAYDMLALLGVALRDDIQLASHGVALFPDRLLALRPLRRRRMGEFAVRQLATALRDPTSDVLVTTVVAAYTVTAYVSPVDPAYDNTPDRRVVLVCSDSDAAGDGPRGVMAGTIVDTDDYDLGGVEILQCLCAVPGVHAKCSRLVFMVAPDSDKRSPSFLAEMLAPFCNEETIVVVPPAATAVDVDADGDDRDATLRGNSWLAAIASTSASIETVSNKTTIVGGETGTDVCLVVDVTPTADSTGFESIGLSVRIPDQAPRDMVLLSQLAATARHTNNTDTNAAVAPCHLAIGPAASLAASFDAKARRLAAAVTTVPSGDLAPSTSALELVVAAMAATMSVHPNAVVALAAATSDNVPIIILEETRIGTPPRLIPCVETRAPTIDWVAAAADFWLAETPTTPAEIPDMEDAAIPSGDDDDTKVDESGGLDKDEPAGAPNGRDLLFAAKRVAKATRKANIARGKRSGQMERRLRKDAAGIDDLVRSFRSVTELVVANAKRDRDARSAAGTPSKPPREQLDDLVASLSTAKETRRQTAKLINTIVSTASKDAALRAARAQLLVAACQAAVIPESPDLANTATEVTSTSSNCKAAAAKVSTDHQPSDNSIDDVSHVASLEPALEDALERFAELLEVLDKVVKEWRACRTTLQQRQATTASAKQKETPEEAGTESDALLRVRMGKLAQQRDKVSSHLLDVASDVADACHGLHDEIEVIKKTVEPVATQRRINILSYAELLKGVRDAAYRALDTEPDAQVKSGRRTRPDHREVVSLLTPRGTRLTTTRASVAPTIDAIVVCWWDHQRAKYDMRQLLPPSEFVVPSASADNESNDDEGTGTGSGAGPFMRPSSGSTARRLVRRTTAGFFERLEQDAEVAGVPS